MKVFQVYYVVLYCTVRVCLIAQVQFIADIA